MANLDYSMRNMVNRLYLSNVSNYSSGSGQGFHT